MVVRGLTGTGMPLATVPTPGSMVPVPSEKVAVRDALVPAVMAAGVALTLWGEQRPARQVRWAAVIVLALAVGAAVRPWVQSAPLPAGASARLDRYLTPEFLRTGEISVEFRNEYVVLGADPQAWRRDRPLPQQDPVLRASAPVQVLKRLGGGADTAVALQVDRPAQVDLARYAFEGWQLTLDGQPLTWRPSASGALQVQLPAGRQLLQLVYRAPPLRLAMVALSALALAGWLLLWLLQRRRGGGPAASSAADS